MNGSSLRLIAAGILATALCSFPVGNTLTAQDQAAQNKTPAKPAEPPLVPGAPLYISPGIVSTIQQKLIELGHPMPTTSGAWGVNSAAGLAEFQRKNDLSPGGDLDELTLIALGMPEVLSGGVPPGAETEVSEAAAASGGAPLSASPRLTRVIQNALTGAGYPPHNVFGIWIAEIDNAPRNFQKAKGLDITNTLDLALIHALGLTDSLTAPKPGKLPTDAVADILSEQNQLLTGAPITASAIGIRQVQEALDEHDIDIDADGKWSEEMTAALKKFQESQKLEPTGSLNLRTLKALGFANPLADIDRPRTSR